MNGATIWARKTITSEIFLSKPDKWFKIWFYIVNRVNYKDTPNWKRGECYIQTGEIERHTGASKDQVKKCLQWLRTSTMISTRRSTRGFHLKVNKYNIYQDFNYYSSTREAPEKHHDSRRKEERKNISEQSSAKKGLKDNKDDMGWNKQGEDDYLDKVVDLDGDGTTHSLTEEEDKQKHAVRKARAEMRRYVTGLRDGLKLPKLDPKQMNWQLKSYETLIGRGWSHKQIGEEFINIVSSDIWKEKMQNKEYPGMNTVEFSLRNKTP